MLTSAARESLRGVETVIVDEVHAVAGTKRGAHLALSLERLDALLARPAQRIGLSATVRPIDEVARSSAAARRSRSSSRSRQDHRPRGRQVPVEDMTQLDEVPRRPAGPDDPAAGGPARAVDLAARRGAGARPDRGSTARRSCSPTRGGWPSG
jgi:ATP-dependent Lhr-like helicase